MSDYTTAVKAIMDEKGCSAEEAIAEYNFKQSYTPVTNLKSFGDVFELWAPWDNDQHRKLKSEWLLKHERGEVKIGVYCTVSAGYGQGIESSFHSIQVKPSKATIDCIKNNMIAIDFDEIYFKIILFPKCDEACVYACYNQIIGSRLIARVDWKTVPEELISKEPAGEE